MNGIRKGSMVAAARWAAGLGTYSQIKERTAVLKATLRIFFAHLPSPALGDLAAFAARAALKKFRHPEPAKLVLAPSKDLSLFAHATTPQRNSKRSFGKLRMTDFFETGFRLGEDNAPTADVIKPLIFSRRTRFRRRNGFERDLHIIGCLGRLDVPVGSAEEGHRFSILT